MAVVFTAAATLGVSLIHDMARVPKHAAVEMPRGGQDAGDHVYGRLNKSVNHRAARGVPRRI